MIVPRISLVIPTYRRPDLLARCLNAVVKQSLNANDYEIIVADDAACAATREQVERIAREVEPAIIYVPVLLNHGPAAARNAGCKMARGEVIAFTDDDTIPDPDWLLQGLGAFERDPELAAATGRTEVPLPKFPTDYERNESGLATAEFITANCFVRRTILENLGGFDERFRSAWREDSDLHFAILESEGKIIKVPSAVVVHPIRPAPWGISIRMQRKSQYDALLFKKHRQLYQKKIGTHRPWNYYAILATLVIGAAATVVEAQTLAVICAVLWLALTIQFVRRRLRGNRKSISHIAEMLITSIVIPPLSIFWRLYGAWKFRTLFY